MSIKALKEELIEIETIAIALDDKLHRIMSQVYKMNDLQRRIEERVKTVKRSIKDLED